MPYIDDSQPEQDIRELFIHLKNKLHIRERYLDRREEELNRWERELETREASLTGNST